MADRALTDLELERWLAGELPAPRVDAATEADRARLEELRVEHAAFLASVDVAAEVAAIGRRRPEPATSGPRTVRWRWLVPGGALVAAAAALVLVVRRADPVAPDADRHTKGDTVGLVVHVAGGAGARRVATGDTVEAGDRVRFEVGVPGPGYVAVVGIDGSGATTVYYPFGGHTPAPIDPRTGGVLPGAIALDATPGDERFILVYAPRTFAIDDALFVALRVARPPAGVSTADVVVHKKTSRF